MRGMTSCHASDDIMSCQGRHYVMPGDDIMPCKGWHHVMTKMNDVRDDKPAHPLCGVCAGVIFCQFDSAVHHVSWFRSARLRTSVPGAAKANTKNEGRGQAGQVQC